MRVDFSRSWFCGFPCDEGFPSPLVPFLQALGQAPVFQRRVMWQGLVHSQCCALLRIIGIHICVCVSCTGSFWFACQCRVYLDGGNP